MWRMETESLKYFLWKYCSYRLVPNLGTVGQKYSCRTINVTVVLTAATFQEQSQEHWASTYDSGNPSLHTGMKDAIANVSCWRGLRMASSREQTPHSQANPPGGRVGAAQEVTSLGCSLTPCGSHKPRGDTTRALWRLLPKPGLGGGWSCLSKAGHDRSPFLMSVTSRGRAVKNSRDGHF